MTDTSTSTFFLTILFMTGLFFFIRASVKERTEQITIITDRPETTISTQLKQYFSDRSYRVLAIDQAKNLVTFEGFVRPSVFLAFFLSFLAGCGMICLIIVLTQLFPDLSLFFWLLILLAPGAGLFYWKKAGRLEKVFLQVETSSQNPNQTILTITGHRDELASLQQTLNL